MKKMIIIFALAALLTGCKAGGELETVMDTPVMPKQAEKMEMLISLPENAASAVMTSEETGTVYFCDDYILTMQTTLSGDMHKTVADTTGFVFDRLPVMETVQGNAKRYDCVWAAVGESGDQVGRCAILDDGNYHYVLTVMADADKAGELSESLWNDVFSSFQIVKPDDAINSGS